MFVLETNRNKATKRIPRETKRMYRLPSIDRIRELREEIAALIKLNVLYKSRFSSG